jgi:hypothetical protein
MTGVKGKGGKKGRSGRKKAVGTLVNEAIDRIDQEMPEIVDKLIQKGLDGDREALIYLVDRRVGKPRQTVETNDNDALFRQFVESQRRLNAAYLEIEQLKAGEVIEGEVREQSDT